MCQGGLYFLCITENLRVVYKTKFMSELGPTPKDMLSDIDKAIEDSKYFEQSDLMAVALEENATLDNLVSAVNQTMSSNLRGSLGRDITAVELKKIWREFEKDHPIETEEGLAEFEKTMDRWLSVVVPMDLRLATHRFFKAQEASK